MEFDFLPEVAFIRIFDYLPLVDRYRVGLVSQSFLRISQIVNGRNLSLDDPMFHELDEDQFEAILRRCHHKVRAIKFRNDFGLLPAKFSEYACPQLIDLDLGTNTISDDVFARIVTNHHPKLKSLKLLSFREDEYDDGPLGVYRVKFPLVTLPNLETLHVRGLNDAMLERLIDRCPNVTNLETSLLGASSEDTWDRFFRSVPRLESLRLELDEPRILMENLEWFYRLPLTSLTITYYDLSDDDAEFMINKLVESFTNIEYLNLLLTNASDDAVAALARFDKLRVAKLSMDNTDFTDEAIRKLSACRHLEQLFLYRNPISDQTFLKLLRNCPRLSQLHVCGVYYDDDEEEDDIDAESAGILLLELANIPHRPSITIEICCRNSLWWYDDGLELRSVWESSQVQNAAQRLKENHGMEINILLVEMPLLPPVDETTQDDDSDVENDDDQSDSDQSDGDETDGDQSDSDQSDSEETDDDETDGDQSDSEETDEDETDGDQSDSDESDGDESDGDHEEEIDRTLIGEAGASIWRMFYVVRRIFFPMLSSECPLR